MNTLNAPPVMSLKTSNAEAGSMMLSCSCCRSLHIDNFSLPARPDLLQPTCNAHHITSGVSLKPPQQHEGCKERLRAKQTQYRSPAALVRGHANAAQRPDSIRSGTPTVRTSRSCRWCLRVPLGGSLRNSSVTPCGRAAGLWGWSVRRIQRVGADLGHSPRRS